MSQNHLLSDSIARIKNAQLVKKDYVVLYFSKLIQMVLVLLSKAGYIGGLDIIEYRKGVLAIKAYLKYTDRNSAAAIKEFCVVSKPGKRVFRSYKKIDKLYGGLGIVILSTSKGIITDSSARNMKVGGEILCNVF